MGHMFSAVSIGESRYLAEDLPGTTLQAGTVLTVSKGGLLKPTVVVSATPPPHKPLLGDAELRMKKALFLRFPPNLRKPISLEERGELSLLAGANRIEMQIRRSAERMTLERAEIIRNAVLKVLKVDNGEVNPDSPFRKTDLVSEAMVTAIAADLRLAMENGRIIPGEHIDFCSFTETLSDDGGFVNLQKTDYVSLIRKAVCEFVSLREIAKDSYTGER